MYRYFLSRSLNAIAGCTGLVFFIGSISINGAIDPIVDSIAGESTYPYRIFIPKDIEPDEKLPLVLYLAGAGEVGTDNERQVTRNIQPLIERTQEPGGAHRAILLAPQTPPGPWDGFLVNQLVGEIEREYPVDRSRMYLTGISFGGAGCHVTLAADPQRWAAVIPLSGLRDVPSQKYMANTPIWLIHGRADIVVGYTESEGMVTAIRNLGGTPRLTLIDGWGHGPWEPLLNNNALYTGSYTGGTPDNTITGYYEWMYSHVLPETPPLPRHLEPGDRVVFDFSHDYFLGDRPDENGLYWNVIVIGNMQKPLYFTPYNTVGEKVFLSVHFPKPFLGYQDRGSRESGQYTVNAQRDFMWTGSTAGHAEALPFEATVELGNLPKDLEYRLTLFASARNINATVGGLTRYTVGDRFVDLDVTENTADTAVFERLVADENGRIRVSVSVSPDGDARIAYLGVLDLEVVGRVSDRNDLNSLELSRISATTAEISLFTYSHGSYQLLKSADGMNGWETITTFSGDGSRKQFEIPFLTDKNSGENAVFYRVTAEAE